MGVCPLDILWGAVMVFNAAAQICQLQDIFIDYRPMQFLYADGDLFTFMDLETYEQPSLDRSQIGDGAARW